jgi:hypothetical protein
LDETYLTYLNRVAKLNLSATYESQIKTIQVSPKFKLDPESGWVPQPFPGYSIITPPANEDHDNKNLYQELKSCQEQLIKSLEANLIVPVAPESFHLTLADLIWDSAWENAVNSHPQFQQKLIQEITDSFNLYHHTYGEEKPIKWQLMGLMMRPRAISVTLVPKDEESYQRLTTLRRAIYQNSGLIGLGIEQHYYFVAHITIAYFGDINQSFSSKNLIETLQDLNMQWIDRPQELTISQAQLRYFSDMSNYQREENWPTVMI